MAAQRTAAVERNSSETEAGRHPRLFGIIRRVDPLGRTLIPSEILPTPFSLMNPFTFLRKAGEQVDRVLGGGPSPTRDQGSEATWAPAIELLQREGAFIVRVELPGVKLEDVKVEAGNDTLTVQGERKVEREPNGSGPECTERLYGRFYRLIALPEGAQPADAQARFQDGILEITIPLAAPKSDRRQIPIEHVSGENGAETQA